MAHTLPSMNNSLKRIIGITGICTGLPVLLATICTGIKERQVRQSGLSATAIVIDTIVEIRKDGFNKKEVKSTFGIYRFNAWDGKAYHVNGTTSGSRIGQQTTVYYNPRNPTGDYFLESDTYGFYLGLFVGGIFMLIGGAFIYSNRYSIRSRANP